MRKNLANKRFFAPIALCLTLAAPTAVLAQAESDLDSLLNTIEPEASSKQPSTAEPAPVAETTPAPANESSAETAPLEVITLPEQAKTAPPAQTNTQSRARIEEVVVTAQRTAENMQDVPIAISAISADDLRRDQISSPQDLNGRIPSLVITSGSQMRNTESPTIRGQGAQFGASPGVVIYIGEVAVPSDPVANNQGGPGKFFDLSSVQVLKGSQGTLFGRNTTGGALLLEPHRPEDNLSVSISTGVSNLSGRKLEGVFNAPIISDTLLVRVGGQYLDRAGFTHDVVTGKDYDSKHYWTARAGLLWKPNESFENYLMSYWTDSKDNGTATVIERINREGLNRAIPGAIGLGALSQAIPGLDITQTANLGCTVLNFFGPSTNCGQDILDEQAARGKRHVQLSGDPTDMLKTGAIIDKARYALSDTLNLVNIASYSAFRHGYRWDLDGSRASLNEFINPDGVLQSDVRTITEELQLQGKGFDDALNFVIGGYYEKTKAKGHIIAKSLMFVDVDQQYEQSKKSFAPFMQGTYDLGHLFEPLEGLNFTLGARRTNDKTSGNASIKQVAVGLVPLVDKSFVAAIESAVWTYTAGLDYKLDGDESHNLLYGKISRGYKTGGIAPISVNPARYTYKPEFVTNYELGQKSDFTVAQIPARLNSAVYYTSYTNLQKAGIDAYVPPNSVSPVPQLGQSIFNVGKAWVAGFEMDLTLQPTEHFSFVGTYGYTRAAYQTFKVDYTGATPQLDCSGQEKGAGNVIDLSCIPYQSAPKQQFSLSSRYTLPLDSKYGDVEASMTYTWTDKQYSGQSSPPQAEPGAWLPSVGLFNASLSWRDIMSTSLDLQLYGSNLANKLYRISNSNQWNLTYFQSSIYSEPRIIGLNLSYHWGE
ncbi:TonB-dependent receptor [Stenotrophobium rhamnosiphilum]|uniref:TonB-dependent receptor plug domain-containing protein n=1 Tax=Stenotrophobium rhamnosiphilum TaxID=2029166 RepID=A0A2T5MD03_9GAMM|nr:TonB-dependent receptor [Stenotrophobium rhamnosiphilum]PTU30462.1 hypothetical protein CJD38_13150 [Stenotrophobium rhamnosiphilum]